MPPLGAGNIAERLGDKCRITVGHFKPRVLMSGHFLGRLKMPGGLPFIARSTGRTFKNTPPLPAYGAR